MKYLYFALACAALALGGQLRHSRSHMTPSAPTAIEAQELPWNQRIPRAVDAFARSPSSERAAMVMETFAAAQEKLKSLAKEVSQRVGGPRAEAEIERLELDRLCQEEGSRFGMLQARAQAARPVLEALAASGAFAGRGEAAIGILVHGSNRQAESFGL